MHFLPTFFFSKRYITITLTGFYPVKNIYNHFHNILGIFDVFRNFLGTASEAMRDCYL